MSDAGPLELETLKELADRTERVLCWASGPSTTQAIHHLSVRTSNMDWVRAGISWPCRLWAPRPRSRC